MTEYIERDDLIRRLELGIKSWGRDCNSNAPVMVRAYEDVLHKVKNLSTADVVEVKHGYYERVSEDTYRCSICHCSPIADINNKWVFTNYCGNCGAIMDKRRDDNVKKQNS